MAFFTLLFVLAFPIAGTLGAVFYAVLWLVFRRLHRRYLEWTPDDPPKKWRRILSIICGVLAILNLIAGAAGWAIILCAGA